MNYSPLLLALAIGLALGAVAVWLLLRTKIAAAVSTTRADFQAQLATLTERVGAKEQQLAELTGQLKENQFRSESDRGQLAAANAQLDAERKAHERLRKEYQDTEAALDQLRADLLLQKQQNGAAVSNAKFLEEKLGTQKQEIEAIQQRFTKDFEAIANRLLVENSTRFGQQSADNLDKLLAPLRDNLKDFKAKLESVQQSTDNHSILLKDQISRIGTEAANLAKALKGDVKVLGNWGENMLDQILERSGLQQGVHYHRQTAAKNDSGDQRFLDVVIQLPESRHLVIDSKVSLKSYEEYVNCADDALRPQHLKAHLDCLRNHFRGLGAKRYHETHGISAPDFVLMYIPIEAAFFVAVGQDPGLFSEALERNVVLITNSTLLATLRTVAHVWRLADQQKYALEIADRGGKLYDKFVGFIDDLHEIEIALGTAQKAWTDASKKLHQGTGNLVAQAEKLRILGVKASKKLPTDLTDIADSEDRQAVMELNGHETPPLPTSPPNPHSLSNRS
jgi:DNA recombination protein RmuC